MRLFVWYQYLDNQRTIGGQKDFMKASCLGPEFSSSQLLHYFKTNNITYEELSSEQIPVRIADLIAAQKTIGWFQGRMEFGPRALDAVQLSAMPGHLRCRRL